MELGAVVEHRLILRVLLSYPLIWQCFNTMLPLGLSLPEDVQPPPVLLAPKPLPVLEPIEMNRDRRRRREPPAPPGVAAAVVQKRKRTEEEGACFVCDSPHAALSPHLSTRALPLSLCKNCRSFFSFAALLMHSPQL